MQNNNIMFISENGIVVHQEDFRQLVEKHRTDNNIEFYIRRSNEYAENFFEPSTNLEVIVFQNIIWNGVLKIDLEETGERLYFDTFLLKKEFKKILRLPFEKDITNYYNNLTQYKNKLFDMKIKLKIHIDKMNKEYPLYNYGFGQIFYKLINIYYKLKGVISMIMIELIKATVIYEKHKKDTLTTTTLCFNHNFGLPMYFKIEEKAFINQIESYLF
jgi:hypothetical protein